MNLSFKRVTLCLFFLGLLTANISVADEWDEGGELVVFVTSWCGPCLQVISHLSDTPHRLVDTDEDMETAQRYGIRSVPTFFCLNDDGEILKQHVGMLSKEEVIGFCTD